MCLHLCCVYNGLYSIDFSLITRPEYETVLTTVSRAPTALPESSQYVDGRPYAGDGRAADMTQVSEPYNGGFHAQPENWLSDDTVEATQFMQSYPALQPTLTTSAGSIADPQLTRVQPNTHFENMYYPNEHIPPNSYPKTEADDMVPISSIPPTTLPVSMAQIPASQLHDCLGEVPAGNGFSQSPLTVTTDTQYTMPSPILLPAAVPFDTTSIISPPQAPQIATMPTISTEVGMPQSMAVVTYPTTMAPHYTAPMPSAVIEHHHHQHAHNQVSITPYMGEANFDMSVQPHPRPPAARRGPFKDQTDRQKTAQTRRDGSCIRCRMQRIRVSA